MEDLARCRGYFDAAYTANMSALPLKADMAGVIGKFAKLRLCLWLVSSKAGTALAY